MQKRSSRRHGQRGQAAMETALLLPWLAFSFMAVFDFGMFTYGLISTESAARVVAIYASQSTSIAQNPIMQCPYALGELADAPGMGTAVTTCTGTSPVRVSTTYIASCADTLPCASVSVTYQTPGFIPIAGMMAGSFSITRTVELPIRS